MMMMKSVVLSSPFRCRKSLRKSGRQQICITEKPTNQRRRNEDTAHHQNSVGTQAQTDSKMNIEAKQHKCVKFQMLAAENDILPNDISNPATVWPRTGWLEMEDEDDYHVYEDIDIPQSPVPVKHASKKQVRIEATIDCTTKEAPAKYTKAMLATRRSCSDSELFRICSMGERYEIEVTNSQQQDVPFKSEPEQGFYKCHDNLEDILEKDLIPDLAPKLLRQKQRHLLREVSSVFESSDLCREVETNCRRRLSLDSGWGESEVAEDEILAGRLDTSLSTASLPSIASSSVSSGIGSLKSSSSTLPPSQEMMMGKEKVTSSDDDHHCLTFASRMLHNNSRPTFLQEKKIPKQISAFEEGVRKLPPHPKGNGTSAVEQHSPPPPPLPPRNIPPKRVSSNLARQTNRRLPQKNLHNHLPNPNHVVTSVEVAQTMEALQHLSQDLLTLINVQKSITDQKLRQKVSPKPFAYKYTPRPRLPSPPGDNPTSWVTSSHANEELSLSIERPKMANALERSATLPCKRTLNFSDSSILGDPALNKSENNNNNISCIDNAKGATDLIVTTDTDEETGSSVRRSVSSHRQRRSSLFRNPLQRRKSDAMGKNCRGSIRRNNDVSSSPKKLDREVVHISNRRTNEVIISPHNVSKATKRRRTLFNLASPFSNKVKPNHIDNSKVRRTLESQIHDSSADEEVLPLKLDEQDKLEVEEAIREGLPVIPFFQTPNGGPKVQNNVMKSNHGYLYTSVQQDSMTVRALATPFTSRRIPRSHRLEDHLILPAFHAKDLLLDGGYFNMRQSCAAKHCKSCTCSKSPLLLHLDNNDDYVKMEARTPNV